MFSYKILLVLGIAIVFIDAAYRQPSPVKRSRRHGYRSPVASRYGGKSAAYRSPIAAASAVSATGYVRPARQVTQEIESRPEPYDFTYDNTDEYGTRLARQESGDANGVVRGSYSYQDANGLWRTVEYYADDTGFHATVNTNEPGVISHKPADAEYIKQ